MRDTRPAHIRDRELRMVGLGHALASGITGLIVGAAVLAGAVFFLVGFFVGWLVFR